MLVIFIIIALGYNLYLIVYVSRQSFKEETPGVGKISKVFLEIFGIFISTIIAGVVIGFISIFFIPGRQWHDLPSITRLLISNFIGATLYSNSKRC